MVKMIFFFFIKSMLTQAQSNSTQTLIQRVKPKGWAMGLTIEGWASPKQCFRPLSLGLHLLGSGWVELTQ